MTFANFLTIILCRNYSVIDCIDDLDNYGKFVSEKVCHIVICEWIFEQIVFGNVAICPDVVNNSFYKFLLLSSQCIAVQKLSEFLIDSILIQTNQAPDKYGKSLILCFGSIVILCSELVPQDVLKFLQIISINFFQVRR